MCTDSMGLYTHDCPRRSQIQHSSQYVRLSSLVWDVRVWHSSLVMCASCEDVSAGSVRSRFRIGSKVEGVRNEPPRQKSLGGATGRPGHST
jgi:hypothetical protein